VGTPQHMALALFALEAGVVLNHVPYRGSAPAVVDLIAGQIPLASVDLTSAYPHIQTGRLMALGLIDGKRFAAAPEIPTIAESGVPGFGRASGFIGLFAPAGTPVPIVKQLSREVAAILATPNAQATARTLTAAIAYQDDEAFGRFLAGESVNWKQALSSLDLAH
ncbi:MAG: Bug family tripartite tricarboxylate transporter substrate binding protein, partial [Xanthobacteraceae bacterium]